MRKIHILLIHCLFWFYKIGSYRLVGQFISSDIKFSLQDLMQPLNISNYLLYIIVFYVNYLFILPKYFKTKQYTKAWIAWILLLGCFIFLRFLVEEIMFPKFIGIKNYSEDTSTGFYIFDNVYYGAPMIIMSFFIWLVNDIITTEKEKTILAEHKYNAEVSFLRNQINPHFIFNTMNNIYSLVYLKSEKALPAIEKLSAIMRYVMMESDAKKISLAKETAYLNNFIELQSLRVKGDSAVHFEINGEINSNMIAPLLLLPFVENGFKHGITNDIEKPFKIKLTVNNNVVAFTCSNIILTGKKDESSGIGLKNVKRRLELIYPNKHKLEITQTNEEYCSHLVIEL